MKMICALVLGLIASNLPAASTSLFVSASANIFASGHPTVPAPGGGGPGVAPSLFGFSAQPGQVITFGSITGTATLSTSLGFRNGPDGNPTLPTSISTFGGLSGIEHDGSGFLVGVFLNSAEPRDPAPPTLDFRDSALGAHFSSLSPEIGQLFFVGDGLVGTGSGNVQQFLVPAGANRLFLGFADALNYNGLPGQYQDNAGSLIANATLTVPEPRSWICIGIGILFLCSMRGKK